MRASRLRRNARRYWAVLASIACFMAFAGAVGAYILDNVRFRWPWDDLMQLEIELAHGQAISPGQGQAVTISGVTVGQIASIRLEDGVAVAGLELERDRAGAVYRNATFVMRPRTLGQDQTMEMDPGRPAPGVADGGRVGDGHRFGLAATQVNVNTDEVLATLDADTRTYLKLLLHDSAEGLRGRESDLRRALKLLEPTLGQVRRVSEALSGRRAELRRLVSNLRRLSEATAERDAELTSLVDASATVFATIGEREVELAAAVERLPAALDSTRAALRDGRRLADEAGPTLELLRPAVRELAPALEAARPLLQEATPILREDLRPLVRDATPLLSELGPPLRDLRRASPPLIRTGEILNHLANELGHNPEGSEEGYLFWTAWLAHNMASVHSTEDAHGAVIRGIVQGGCSSLNELVEASPVFLPLVEAGVCP